ncbi:MAG: hypothetical protein ACD_78C00417G0001, partial [uncultured bacterium (gcode 4)]
MKLFSFTPPTLPQTGSFPPRLRGIKG